MVSTELKMVSIPVTQAVAGNNLYGLYSEFGKESEWFRFFSYSVRALSQSVENVGKAKGDPLQSPTSCVGNAGFFFKKGDILIAYQKALVLPCPI